MSNVKLVNTSTVNFNLHSSRTQHTTIDKCSAIYSAAERAKPPGKLPGKPQLHNHVIGFM